MPNMNITYKMLYVSTKLYSYMYVYTVRNQKIKMGWGGGPVKCYSRLSPLENNHKNLILYRLRKEKGSNFQQDEIISLATI